MRYGNPDDPRPIGGVSRALVHLAAGALVILGVLLWAVWPEAPA